MNRAKLVLFASGLFFGGAIDHAILASLGRGVTPYGYELGVAGNWMMSVLDLAVSAGLYRLHRFLEVVRSQ